MKPASLLAAVLVLGPSVAQAAVVYSEDFNSYSFQGPQLPLSSSDNTSERYNPTYYYTINNANNWTFGGSTAYYAVGGSPANGALLLNEPSGAASVTVAGLTFGNEYELSFDVWGDNRPGSQWSFQVSIDNILQSTFTGTDGGAGVGDFQTLALTFIAAGTSAVLSFAGGSLSQASPIIDNVRVAETPLPAALPLFASGLGVMAITRWRRKRKAAMAA